MRGGPQPVKLFRRQSELSSLKQARFLMKDRSFALNDAFIMTQHTNGRGCRDPRLGSAQQPAEGGKTRGTALAATRPDECLGEMRSRETRRSKKHVTQRNSL